MKGGEKMKGRVREAEGHKGESEKRKKGAGVLWGWDRERQKGSKTFIKEWYSLQRAD